SKKGIWQNGYTMAERHTASRSAANCLPGTHVFIFMSYDIVFHSLATVAYLLLSLLIWRPLLAGREATGSGAGSRGLLALVLVLHGVAVHLSMLHEDSLRLTWSVGLSL